MTGDELWEGMGCATRVRARECRAFRLVESQEKAATMHLVDSYDEQDLLEQLLEENKPAAPAESRGLHYLLMTPFRYPPLPYGSRFGRAHERGIFYAGLSLRTALAECAYYRLVFLDGMATPFPQPLTTYHTSFAAEVTAAKCLDLSEPAFDGHQARLCSPVDYRLTQELGTRARAEGVDAVVYWSARCSGEEARNIGVFEPAALSPRPMELMHWICRTATGEVRYTCETEPVIHSFPRETFMVGERLPQPAVAG